MIVVVVVVVAVFYVNFALFSVEFYIHIRDVGESCIDV